MEPAAMSGYYRAPSSGLHQRDVSPPPADTVAGILPIPPEPEEQKDRNGSGERWHQERSSYRVALERMAADMLVLRRRAASLEVENSGLRRRRKEDVGCAPLHHGHTDVDVMTSAEGALQQRAAAETRRLRDRVQQLQNQLIRKNDQEKDLVMLQRAQQQQRAALRSYKEKVAKMKGLEETVRQQEKLIRTMEQMLEEQLSRVGRSTEQLAGKAPAGELHNALLAENLRLREELARARPPAPHTGPAPPPFPVEAFGSHEKLSLLAQLERARARGRVLEGQLAHAARTWAREKQELSTRLLEHHHGFGGSSLARNTDAVTAQPVPPSRRPQQQDPLP